MHAQTTNSLLTTHLAFLFLFLLAPTGEQADGGFGGRGAGGYGGGYGGPRGGDRDGGDRPRYGDRDGGDRPRYGDREGGDRPRYGDRDGGERRSRFNEDGEEEPEAPSRADEADKWRRKAPVAPERSRDEMPGRSDNEDRWRPRGGDRPTGGFGGPRSFGGDRGYGDRDGGRGYGDRDGGRGYGDRDGGRGYGDRDGGRFGGDRDGGRDFGGNGGGDSRPAHLKNLVRRGAGADADAPASQDAPAAAPTNDRFKRDEAPAASEESSERQERPRFGGDRDGGDRPRYGGDRDGGDRPRYGDRDGGDRPRYGDRDGGRDGGRFGDRDGGRPSGGYGGDRFGDRDGGRPSGGYGGDRFGDRDGGRPSGGYGGDRFGGRDGPAPRYGGYGGARTAVMDGPLPSGPIRQEEYEPRPARLALQKPKKDLDAKPQSLEERKVEVDASLTAKGVVALADKITPLESAAEENTTITDAQLIESMNRLKIADKAVPAYGNVLAKSLIDGTVSLGALVAKSSPELLIASLSQLRTKKNDKYLLDLVSAARAKQADLDVVAAIAGDRKDAALDAFLESQGLLALKPIPDLTEGVSAQLAANAAPSEILASINAQVSAKVAPGVPVATAVAAHVFALAFKEAGKVDLAAITPFASLLQRVAPNSDADAQVRVLFEAQAAWFKAGVTKAILKELFQSLLATKLIRAQSFDAWSNDTKDKAKNGKMKALLQVSAWITEIQPKTRVNEEPESDADEELMEEYGEGN